jgi:hypothetical protein
MITLNFAPQCRLSRIETVELPDRSAFFDYYQAHNDRGIIFNVQEVQDDRNNRPCPPQDKETLREVDGQAGENRL